MMSLISSVFSAVQGYPDKALNVNNQIKSLTCKEVQLANLVI